jgi:hypothetical protein
VPRPLTPNPSPPSTGERGEEGRGPSTFLNAPNRRTGTSANDLLEQLCGLLKEPGEARQLAARLLLDFAHVGKEQRLLRWLGEYAGDSDEGVRKLALAALERLQERDNQ